MSSLLFDSLKPDVRAFALEQSPTRTLRKDEPLFHHGDEADSMYLVDSGRLAVQTSTRDGHTSIVRVIGPGRTVGDLALMVDGLRRTGTVVALEAATLRVITRSVFSAMRERDPGVDRLLVGDLAMRLAELSDRWSVRNTGASPSAWPNDSSSSTRCTTTGGSRSPRMRSVR